MILEQGVDVDLPVLSGEWGPVPKDDGEIHEAEVRIAVPVVNAGRNVTRGTRNVGHGTGLQVVVDELADVLKKVVRAVATTSRADSAAELAEAPDIHPWLGVDLNTAGFKGPKTITENLAEILDFVGIGTTWPCGVSDAAEHAVRGRRRKNQAAVREHANYLGRQGSGLVKCRGAVDQRFVTVAQGTTLSVCPTYRC